MITATTNAVNIADGLDGLAAGAALITFAAYALMGFWQFGQSCAKDDNIKCYEVRDPLDLAIVAAAFAAAVFGFLWFNTSPASIIMGDTGSFAIGGGVGEAFRSKSGGCGGSEGDFSECEYDCG